ncbi:outer membrane beta-barrel protein [Yeosuana sp. MJ-SS3]|uniref:Outer membrane beta-barrel protein n=1 Tax=Gilvirhabdus luticola TaxID=3079858 RepID=A0ABU3UA39_9FLAO|nr:outer membrane beta-barrel protein [Yeosuana sp. MJ-SS3]MDU8887272.1 outer membrane beta-barrel protein [Yeosuana sp. MJ-SS3]
MLSFMTAQAQGFKVGANVGLPIGDASDGYSFNITLDVNFIWEVSEDFGAGIATGYSHNFGESVNLSPGISIDIDDASFIPISGAARYNVSEKFVLGADLGYSIGISPSGNDGGFYYAPRMQYALSESLDLVAAYRGVSLDGGSLDVITLGLEFAL